MPDGDEYDSDMEPPTDYIKDLTTVQPDLSKVIIIDNASVSYDMQPENAIPCLTWVGDPHGKCVCAV